jgi:hypothetical protein
MDVMTVIIAGQAVPERRTDNCGKQADIDAISLSRNVAAGCAIDDDRPGAAGTIGVTGPV